jgi:hypothetical protein
MPRTGDGGSFLLAVTIYNPDPFGVIGMPSDRVMSFDANDAEEAAHRFAEYVRVPISAVARETVDESQQVGGIWVPAGALILFVHPNHPDVRRDVIEPFAVAI